MFIVIHTIITKCRRHAHPSTIIEFTYIFSHVDTQAVQPLALEHTKCVMINNKFDGKHQSNDLPHCALLQPRLAVQGKKTHFFSFR